MLITKRDEVTKQGFCKILWRKLRLREGLLEFVWAGVCWGGRLFEVGANSRLGAYSNKYGILSTNQFDLRWKENSFIKIDWDPVELSRKTVMISTKPRRPRGLLALIFAGYVPLASQSP